MTRYEKVAGMITARIGAGALRPGDRLPSVRQMSRITGFSAVTVLHGYELLESRGLCRAQPRSGYFVTAVPPAPESLPDTAPDDRAEDLHSQLLRPQQDRRFETFGAMWICDDLIPRAQADRIMRQSLRTGSRRLAEGLEPDGDLRMREEICRHIARRGTFAQPGEILITGSAIQACNLCLDSFTRPGDTVLVESPGYFPLLATLRRRDLKVIEITPDPLRGLDPEEFARLLAAYPVRAAILTVTNHFPTGVTCPPEVMEQLVAIAARHGTVIIENDMFGDLGYRPGPRVTLRHFDQGATVVQIGSFEFTLPPEYGYGWVVGGLHKRDLLVTHYMNGHRLRDGFVQWGIARYLSGRSYDRQLRNLNRTLARRMQEGRAILTEALGGRGVLSDPAGGFTCWLSLPAPLDQGVLLREAGKARTSFLPGTIFAPVTPDPGANFAAALALNFSFRWTQETSARLRHLASLLCAR